MTSTERMEANLLIRAKLMEAKEMLGSVYQLRHFASYTIDYDRQCLTGHYYRLQYIPADDAVILIDLHPSSDNSTKHFN